MIKTRFMAYLNDGQLRLVGGWQMQCGAVAHRTLLPGAGTNETGWSVSDPVSGGRIVSGRSMGDAIKAYRMLRAMYGPHYNEMLATVREAFFRKLSALAQQRKAVH